MADSGFDDDGACGGGGQACAVGGDVVNGVGCGLGRVDLCASIRNCTAAYSSSACFAHVSHRSAIWVHVAFSSPRVEHAMRLHSAAWLRNSSHGFTAVPRRMEPAV
jgi:hypothetical protein